MIFMINLFSFFQRIAYQANNYDIGQHLRLFDWCLFIFRGWRWTSFSLSVV